MFSPLHQRLAAVLTALSLAIGLVAGPVHLHSHEHAHVGDDGQTVVHHHAHGHGHHHGEEAHPGGCGHDHAPGPPCEHDEDNCATCQFVGKVALPVALQFEAAEAPCFERVMQSAPQCESALPLRLALTRGPPPRDA